MDSLIERAPRPTRRQTLDKDGNWLPASPLAGTEVKPPCSITMAQADGFVVVSQWLPSRFTGTKYSYEAFSTLAKAVAYHRRIVAGVVRDEAPRGIFASIGGLPTGGALAAEIIDSVEPDPAGNRMPPRSSPNTPENRFLKESAIFNGKSARQDARDDDEHARMYGRGGL